MVGIENLWWHDLRATFCTRRALAVYEALTIMSLMGHKDLKATSDTFVPSNFNVTCGQFSLSTNWPQMNGVNPLVETVSIEGFTQTFLYISRLRNPVFESARVCWR